MSAENYLFEDRRRGLTFDAVDRAGTERQVAAAAQAGVSRFLYVSGIGADPSAMVKLINELESTGLAKRERRPGDRRA